MYLYMDQEYFEEVGRYFLRDKIDAVYFYYLGVGICDMYMVGAFGHEDPAAKFARKLGLGEVTPEEVEEVKQEIRRRDLPRVPLAREKKSHTQEAVVTLALGWS